MVFDIKSTLFIIYGFQCLLLVVLFLTKRKKSLKTFTFSILLFGFSLLFVEYGTFLNKENYNFGIHTYGYRYPIRFMIGPLFLFYIILLVGKKINLKSYWIKHSIVPLLSFISLITILVMNKEKKIDLLTNTDHVDYVYYYMLTVFNSILSMLSNVVYVIFGYVLISKYRKLSLNYHSNNEKIEISALFYFAKVFCAIIIIKFLVSLDYNVSYIQIRDLYYFSQTIFALSVIVLGIIVLRQRDLLSLPLFTDSKKQKIIIINEALNWEEELSSLDAVMQDQQLYLNPNLTIKDVADSIGLPQYKLSELINKGRNTSFSDYVNNFRVEKAKKLLSIQEHNDKLLKIAMESGFSNTTSLHRTFKKITGITPNTFRKKLF